MIVFDVDGTLIGGETVDWASFDAAFEEVAGFVLPDEFFTGIEEVTATAIIHEALNDFAVHERVRMERAVSEGYLRRLKHAHQNDSGCFPANEGALVLIQQLQQHGIPIAIATGDWRDSIVFKLSAAGLFWEDIPMATSSEHYSRAEIIAAAVSKAGRSLEEAVYVGDGLWDFRACQKLGIPFIGVGDRGEMLRSAGATRVLKNLSPAEFWRALDSLGDYPFSPNTRRPIK
ncbi:MAG: HAD hydrolase-like protein [Verrucomicrobia bacterium]|nr:HAD hydrolase-like protein [Verrucomicrobiota bacterium]